jgi:hypothetical protein
MSFPQPSDYRPPIIPDGEVYDNPENGRSYYWTQIVRPDGSTGGYWTVVCEGAGDKYLLRHGDTITDADDDVTYTWNDGVIIKSEDTGFTGVRLESSRSKLTVRTEDGEGDVKVEADDTFSTNSAYNYIQSNYRTTITSTNSDVIIAASAGAERVNRVITDSDIDQQITNKRYVNEQDELLRQDIIELEEEIDAIAPSLEYGNWEWAQPPSNARAPEKGTFYLLDGLGQLTTEYKDTAIVVINNYEYDDPTDSDPVDIHTWADADPGELIQLFDAADPDFMLGKIIAVTPASESTSNGLLEFVRIEIELIQSSGVPNDNADPVTGKYLTRVNVFKEPSGGTASDFVLKSGDTMEGPGPLMFKTAKTSYNSSSPGSGTAYVKFQNKYGSGSGVHEVNMFMGGGSSSSNGLCITGRPLHVSNTIYSSGQYKARSSSAEYNPSIYLASEEGQIRYNGNTKFTWKSDGIREMIIKNNDGDKGMVIKRDRSTTNRVEWSGVVDIDTSGTNRCIGELWYNKNDGVMYLRIS